MLARLARFSARRRRLMVFGIWIPLLIGLGVASATFGSDFATEFDIPDSETSDVQSLLEASSPQRAGFTGEIVFRTENGVTDPAVQEAMTTLFSRVDALEEVSLTSPYDMPTQISQSGVIAFAALDIAITTQGEALAISEEIQKLDDDIRVPGLQIEYGGNVFAEFELPASEAYGLLAAMIILVLAFGSILAMGLPIGTALVGLGVGAALVTLASNVLPMPDFTTSLVAMIGLGVGIDYALFIVTRFKEGLDGGFDVEDAIVEAVDTSGRAVIFAGITVIISLLGLFIMGLAFARGLAMGAIIGVLLMMIASISLLPALLAMVGRKIGVTSRAALVSMLSFVAIAFFSVADESLPIFLTAVAVAVAIMLVSFAVPAMRKPLPERKVKPKESTFWYRWSRFIQRRPWPAAIGATVLLLVLAAPLLSIRLGFGDNGNAPKHSTVRKAYDMLAEGFGPGFNGPLYITVQGDVASDPEALQGLAESLTALDAVAVAQGVPLTDDLALVIAYPTTAPQDAATSQLVNDLRETILPSLGVDAMVGGFTAGGVDFANVIGSRMPFLFIGVLSLSFLLLLAVFRSLLVPLKAVILNLLGIGAAYGVIVAIFQWGWGMQLIGVDKAGPIETWAPMMLFAIVFGLSMDYEVFLLSRIKEEYDNSRDNATAVADGLTATARVITAAALIMVCVFAAFVLGYDRQLKLFGLGLATAVAIDATIIRMVLVPATMELLGERNWWMPKWLDRIVPRIDVEGHHHTPPKQSV
jgi:RND superfamily putative drug exporter